MSHTKLLWLLPLALLCACNSKYNGAYEAAPSTTAQENQYLAKADSVSFSTDITSLNSPSRKVIHTAYFRCRVQNVYTATSQLENMVKSAGGIVQESKMENSSSDVRTISYKPDSLKQVQVYQTTSTLTLRVPVGVLDSVLNIVPQLSAFVEQRNLKQDDVTLKYLSNALINQPGKTDYTNRALKNAKKTDEVLNVDQYESDKKEQTINRKVENLQMLEDVNYATVNITFFQPEQVDTHVIVNSDYFTRASFGTQLFSAIGDGWELLRNLIVGLVRLWPYLILITAAIFGIKKLRGKRFSLLRRRA